MILRNPGVKEKASLRAVAAFPKAAAVIYTRALVMTLTFQTATGIRGEPPPETWISPMLGLKSSMLFSNLYRL